MSQAITAAVTTFNGGADLVDCLRSILSQEGVSFDEVIVVDNASSDGTPETLRREFPDVRLIVMESNEGPCTARNRALEEAKNDIVFQVDHDVVVRPDCVKALLDEYLTSDEVAVVTPRALDSENPELVHYDGGSFHYAGVMSLRHFYQPLAECSTEAEDVDAFISLAALVDRRKLLEVGGYDKALFILFEDHDLSYRLRGCGYRIRALPFAIVDHRSGTEGISFRGGPIYPPRRLFLHSRNRWLVVLKCYRWRTIIFAMPGILLLGMAYVFFAWRQGALSDYVRAKSSLISLFPHVKEERRKFAALRKCADRDLLGAPDLTFSPRIMRGRGSALAESLLGVALRIYYWLIRWFLG